MKVLTFRHAAAALGAIALSASLAAQPSRQTPAPQPSRAADPTQAQADVPALAYRSALNTFRPWGEQAPGDWRALNDEVTRIGGWRSYLREVNQAPAAPAPSKASTPALAPPAAAPASASASAGTANGPATGPVSAEAAAGNSTSTPTATPTPKGSHHGHH